MAVTATTAGLIRKSGNHATRTIRELDRSLTTVWATAWTDIAPSVAKALETHLKASGGTWSRPSEISRSVPLRTMLNDIRKTTVKLSAHADTAVSTASRDVAVRAAGVQTEIISSQLPVAWRPVLMEATAGETRLSRVVTRASRRITTLTRAVPAAVDRALRQVLAQGVPSSRRPEIAVRKMVRRLESAFNSGLSRILTISGTEVMDVHRAASAAGMLDHSDVLEGWIWISRMARNTCSACLSLHGTVHPLSEPGPDGHARCHCQRAPKARSWKSLGIDIGLDDPFEPEDLVADAQKFFHDLPDDDQLKIMGPTRLRLLRQGRISWSDLAMARQSPRWRRSFVPTPVNRLPRSS